MTRGVRSITGQDLIGEFDCFAPDRDTTSGGATF